MAGPHEMARRTKDQDREVAEAIAAGRRALASLEEAAEALESAGRWGVFDIFAGGMLTSLVKHSRIGDAKDALARARADLMDFTRELSDVRAINEVRIDVGGLNTAIDILLDNPLVDIYVQRQIDDAQDTVNAAIKATKVVLRRLGA